MKEINESNSLSQINILRNYFKTETVSTGKIIWSSYELNTNVFLLLEGSAKIILLHPEINNFNYKNCRKGDWFGELFLLNSREINYNIVASSDCILLRVTSEEIEFLATHQPIIALQLLQTISKTTLVRANELQKTYNKLFQFSGNAKIDAVLSNSVAAQKLIDNWTDSQLDTVITDIAQLFRSQIKELAQLEINETQIGNAEDKQHKLGVVVNKVFSDLLGLKTKGFIRKIETKIEEYASPIGVIFAVIPMTNPVTNSLFKALIAIKTRNALVVSYPRAALKIGSQTIAMIQKILTKHGLPETLIQHVPLPSSKWEVKSFMSHPKVNLVLATGGPTLVKAAYSSGNPAFGVGPGNVPVFISRTANIEEAVRDIIKGKTYDNGIVCGSESNLIVDNTIKKELCVALENLGAIIATTKEKENIFAKLFDNKIGRLKQEYIGKKAEILAKVTGISRNLPIKLLVIPAERDDLLWLSHEKMAPILVMYTVKNIQAGISLAKIFLENEGAGHTAVIHSQNQEEIRDFAELPVGRILVNTPATHGMLGETTAIPTSFMIGSGTYGGNITTDEITWHHFVNFKKLAYDINKQFLN